MNSVDIETNNEEDRSIGAVAASDAHYGRPGIPLGAYQKNEVGIEAVDFVRDSSMCAAWK